MKPPHKVFVSALAMTLSLALSGCDETPPVPEAPQTLPNETGTTENGADYEILRAGNGRKPSLEDYVTVHFSVMREDGTAIDDSRRAGAPQTHLLSDTLPGWQEVLPKVSEGGVVRTRLPAELAFGEEGLGDIVSPGEALSFEIELVKVETGEEFQARRIAAFKEREEARVKNAKFLEENAEKPGVVTLDSGLQYEVLQDGGGPTPALDDRVRVHYRGTLIDGTEFDSSHKRGEAAEFTVGQLIKGWQEALTRMPEGAKWRLVVPSDLAYGDRGAGTLIQPGDTLVFEIELLRVL